MSEPWNDLQNQDAIGDQRFNERPQIWHLGKIEVTG
jgi:hypothetical protein